MSNTVPVPTVNGVANGEFFSCHYSVVDLFVEFFKNFTSYKFVAVMSSKIMHMIKKVVVQIVTLAIEPSGQFIDSQTGG